MKNISLFAVAALSFAMLTGCAQMGPAGETASKVGSSALNTAGNVFGALDHKTGVEVTEAQMKTFTKGRTRKQDVINTVGHPTQKNEAGGKEIWTYTFTHIPALPFAKNRHENTVFEFNRNGTLHSHYKAAGTPGRSGNALLDAAGM